MWSPQRYLKQGRKRGVSEESLTPATQILDRFYDRGTDLPALLSLRHLAHRTQVDYSRLRAFVARSSTPYRRFTIRKRSGGIRTISVPHPALMNVQRWLTVHILNKQPVHAASFAFAPGSSIVRCAARHTGARWLVKLDVSGFFDSISEIAVFRIFRDLGYQPLVSFELARLTTDLSDSRYRYKHPQWQSHKHYTRIPRYKESRMGHLPQGAPTSPMLSNLAMREIDEKIQSTSTRLGVTYTRYSDDLTFSTREGFDRRRAVGVVRSISNILRPVGLYPNQRKTAIVPPGARKVVLGLVVNGS